MLAKGILVAAALLLSGVRKCSNAPFPGRFLVVVDSGSRMRPAGTKGVRP